jgi:thiol-disulfide isomerase/thioredoxin
MRPITLAAAGLLLCGCLLLAGCPLLMVAGSYASRPRPEVRMASDFTFTGMDGAAHNLSDYYGRPLVLNFWADWCPPCVGEFPAFAEVYGRHAGQFELVSIAAPSSRDAAGFVAANGYGWVFGMGDETTLMQYEVAAIPDTLFIDARGRIVKRHLGGMSAEEFEAALAEIL